MPVTKEMLAKRAEMVRMGGKGTMRRTTRTAPKASSDADKKLQGTLKKLGVAPIGDVEEASFQRVDGTTQVFTKPKVQAAMQTQCYVITGPSVTQ